MLANNSLHAVICSKVVDRDRSSTERSQPTERNELSVQILLDSVASFPT